MGLKRVSTPYRAEDVTVSLVEEIIGIKAKNWEMRCHEIASLIVDRGIVAGRAVYGHYLGPVSAAEDSLWKGRSDLPFVHHGWIELEDGRIMDPTRWSFEAKKPYIFIQDSNIEEQCRTCNDVEDEHEHGFFRQCTVCDCPDFEARKLEYDEGGNRFRRYILKPPPAFNPASEKLKIAIRKRSRATVLLRLKNPPWISVEQGFWLANVPVDEFGELVMGDLYAALIKGGHGPWIPIDNRNKICGPQKEA